MPAIERHRSGRGGWLRAAVLGGDDGIVSTAALLIGVAAAGSARGAVLVAGLAGMVAGALSMAAGNTSRSVPSATPNALISGRKPRRWPATLPPSGRSWLPCTCNAG